MRLSNVHFRILKGVSTCIGSGITVIAGPNGSGKTTLLKLISGLVRPWRGDVTVLGMPAVKARLKGLVAASLSPPVLDNASSVKSFLNLHLSLCRAEHGFAEEVAKALKIGEFINEKVLKLSSGQRRRVDLVRAISCLREGGVLVLDEPSEGLDGEARRALVNLLKEVRRRASAAIITTHDYKFATELSEVGVSHYLYLDSGGLSNVSFEDVRALGRVSGSGIRVVVKAVVRGDIPVKALKSIDGVKDVKCRVDVDWVLRKLGLDGLAGAPVVLGSGGGGVKDLKVPPGFEVLRLAEAQVFLEVWLSSFNSLPDVLSVIRERGEIVDVRIEG